MAASSSYSNDFVLIEYPGVVENLDKAVETLGGKESIEESLSGGKGLELRYQPENLYQNGIVADKKTSDLVESGLVQLVFKVRRKKSDPSVCKTECLGMVKTVFSFKMLCDFTYLPVQKHPTATAEDHIVYEDLVPRLVPTTLQDSFSWWTHKEPEGQRVPSFLPPFIYSRYSSGVQTKILIQESDRLGGLTPNAHGQNLRTERKAFTITVQGTEEFPTAPTEVAIADVDARIKREDAHKLIKELFEERPMWSRIAIICRTGLEDSTLKILMAKYGFYILSGAWGRLWCRFGYDPRKTPDAKRYQSVMVSFRKHNQIPERQRLRLNQNERHSQNTGTYDYIYKQNQLPAVRQMWYCICDVELPAAQKILRSDFYGTLKECDPSSGWLPPKVIEDIRNAIKDNVKKTTQVLDETLESTAVSDASDHENNDDFETSSFANWEV